jgi:hypothetical protein
MSLEIQQYNDTQSPNDQAICNALQDKINTYLPQAESKVWHGHPVWFLNGNPIVGYSKQKAGIRLMFWSGADFEEPDLLPGTGKFKDASIFYISVDQIHPEDLKQWLKKSVIIQWDYKNIVKRKGLLEKITQDSSVQ